MGRKKEYVKKNEARILMFLRNVDGPLKNGQKVSIALNIDYVYVMTLMRGMYTKGWIRQHEFEGRRYFNPTQAAPIEAAKNKLIKKQADLRENVDRETKESSVAPTGNEGQQDQQL